MLALDWLDNQGQLAFVLHMLFVWHENVLLCCWMLWYHYVVKHYANLLQVELCCKTLHYVMRCYTLLQDNTLHCEMLCYIVRRYTTFNMQAYSQLEGRHCVLGRLTMKSGRLWTPKILGEIILNDLPNIYICIQVHCIYTVYIYILYIYISKKNILTNLMVYLVEWKCPSWVKKHGGTNSRTQKSRMDSLFQNPGYCI